MKTNPAIRGLAVALLATAWGLCLAGCEYDVPVTAAPTEGVNQQLCGEWLTLDGWMKIRGYDDAHYVINFDGKLHRAWHSTVAGVPLVTVQNIDQPERKYHFLTWRLADDGRHLILQVVNDKLIPDETRDSATVAKLVSAHAQNPDLLGRDIIYTRQ